MRLVSISGAQSCGKTSVLDAIKLKDLEDFYVDDFKAARVVLEKFGEPLTEIVKDAAKLIEFQTLVFDAKYEQDKALRSLTGSNLIVLVERSPIDVISFALSWKFNTEMENLEVYRDWVDTRYFQRCIDAHKELYDLMVYLPIGVFDHVDDGVRAKKNTQEKVDRLVSYLGYSNGAVHEVIGSSIQDRVDEIIDCLRSN